MKNRRGHNDQLLLRWLLRYFLSGRKQCCMRAREFGCLYIARRCMHVSIRGWLHAYPHRVRELRLLDPHHPLYHLHTGGVFVCVLIAPFYSRHADRIIRLKQSLLFLLTDLYRPHVSESAVGRKNVACESHRDELQYRRLTWACRKRSKINVDGRGEVGCAGELMVRWSWHPHKHAFFEKKRFSSGLFTRPKISKFLDLYDFTGLFLAFFAWCGRAVGSITFFKIYNPSVVVCCSARALSLSSLLLQCRRRSSSFQRSPRLVGRT